jgi:NAD(P)H-hydrate epimerase
LSLAKKLCRNYHGVLVLKGHRTLVVDGGRWYENRTGNPGMAKGGSGDVLAGMIASFIGQGLDSFEAAVWAVYFHGRAGDLAVRKKGELSLLASDLIDFLPNAFKSRA